MLYYGLKPESFGQLGALVHQFQHNTGGKIELKVKFLRPYCVAYLDQAVLAFSNTQHKFLKVVSTYPEVNRYLEQVGFAHLAKNAPLGKMFPEIAIIKVKRFLGEPIEVESAVVEWLASAVRPFLPMHSPRFWKKIVENFWEIVHNSLLHGKGDNGVSSCGQFYPQMGYLEVAFCDDGHGIPKLVKDFGALAKVASDCDCIAWAVKKGNSTLPLSQSAGLGLHLLREFLRLNGGVFQIVSGNGYYGQIGQEEPLQATLKNSIPGTVVNVRVIYDDNLYRLRGEKP